MSQYKEIDNSIIESAKHNEDAFIQLYKFYWQRIWRFLLIRTGNQQLAEDLTQETFMKVLNKLSDYQVTGAVFSSWLMQIALNESRMYFRKTNNQATAELDTIATLWPDQKDQHQQWLDFFLAINNLTEEEQELLIMKYVEDMSNQEIANILQISANNCGVKIHRALTNLQTYL